VLDLQGQTGLELGRGVVLQAPVRPDVVVVAPADLDPDLRLSSMAEPLLEHSSPVTPQGWLPKVAEADGELTTREPEHRHESVNRRVAAGYPAGCVALARSNAS